jgi:hypothetical protein
MINAINYVMDALIKKYVLNVIILSFKIILLIEIYLIIVNVMKDIHALI